MKEALLIIYVQNDYFSGGANELVRPYEAEKRIQELIAESRAIGRPIIYIQHINPPDDSDIFFGIERAPELIWVDRESSTDTCIHLYYYCLFFDRLPDGETPMLTVCTADLPVQDASEEQRKEELIPVPATRAVRSVCFAEENGRKVELSPFSMKVTLSAADNDLGEAMAVGYTPDEMIVVPDPACLEKIEIVYEDGSVYTVLDQGGNMDNTIYMCGGIGTEGMDTSIMLNRLVDTGKVKEVIINGMEYGT